MTAGKPFPTLRGEERAWFEEARSGRLVFQQCRACDERLFPPRTVCPACMSEELHLVASQGRGLVHSFTTMYVPGHPAFADDVPYTVVLVDLDEGVRMLADLVDCAPEEARVGMPVEVRFDPVDDELAVPRFRPITGGSAT